MKTIESATELAEAKMCRGKHVLAIHDTLNVITGKWKLPIIANMIQGQKRFNDILRVIPKLTPRMLSKELRDLEANGMVKRQVFDTQPVMIEYTPTPSAMLLTDVVDKMIEWGLQHRERIIASDQANGE